MPSTDEESPRWLVLCHLGDPSAPWAWAGLRHRGLPVTILTAEELAFSTSLAHRVGRLGASFDVALTGGRVVSSGRLRGVLNRLVTVPDDHAARASDTDRAYAASEVNAVFTSALHGLPGAVLNRAVPRGLSGPWLSPPEWVAEAARSGLPVEPYPVRSALAPAEPAAPTGRTVFVVGDRTVTAPSPWGDAPAGVVAGCRALAHRSGVALLGVDFTAGEAGPWTFAGASARPDLRLGGPPLLDALLVALTA